MAAPATPAAPASPASTGAVLDPGPRLGHDHDWTLRVVDFVDGLAVEELECGCGAVTFR